MNPPGTEIYTLAINYFISTRSDTASWQLEEVFKDPPVEGESFSFALSSPLDHFIYVNYSFGPDNMS